MIDVGLILSVVAAVGLPMIVSQRWPIATSGRPADVFDAVTTPLLVGLATARLATMLLDDPAGLRRVTEVLIIRSGVEFWPGVLAAAGVVGLVARRAGVPPIVRLASLAPLGLVGVAAYEATCVFRGGCFGPVSPIGLRPDGVATTMLPIGWLVALALIVGATAIHHLAGRCGPGATVAAAIFTLAAARSIGSFWLPHLGPGLTRQHVTSLVIAGLSGLGVAIGARRCADREEGRRRPPPDRRSPF